MVNNMWRNIAGLIAGFLVAMALVACIETLGFVLLTDPPAGLDSPDPQVMQAAIAKLPTFSFVMVLLAFTAGAFGGPLVAALICRGKRLVFAVVIGLVLWSSSLYWLLHIPSPLILWSSLVIMPIATLAGGLLALFLTPSPREGVQPYDMRKKGMACK
jgi:hypothetical protein